MLGGAYARPQYYDVSKCEYPPTRADLAQSVYFPYANHQIAQTPCITAQDPKAWGLAVRAGNADLLRHQPPGLDPGLLEAVRGAEEDIQRRDRRGDVGERLVCRHRAARQDLSGIVALRADPRNAGHRSRRYPPADGEPIQPRARRFHDHVGADEAARISATSTSRRSTRPGASRT